MAKGQKTQERIQLLENICEYTFENRDLAIAALTHPSALLHEGPNASYERLEFLGDSILGAVVATYLYDTNPTSDEGELTKVKNSLVWGDTLAQLADDLGIGSLIVMGDSERGTGSRGMHSALENVYEAIVGAIFLDGGIEPARSFILNTLMSYESISAAEHIVNPKSRLQELVQKEYRCAPEYKLLEEKGPAHNPTFTTAVLIEGRRVGRGSGSSKKASESAAAADALSRMGYETST